MILHFWLHWQGRTGWETPTWSISMSLGKAFGHSMATLTMSDGGGMVWVGGGDG